MVSKIKIYRAGRDDSYAQLRYTQVPCCSGGAGVSGGVR